MIKLNNTFHLDEKEIDNSNYKKEILITIVNTYNNMFKDILNVTFEKANSKIGENISDTLINENLVNESKISNTMNNTKQLFVCIDESFTKIIDIDEDNAIKKEKESNILLSYGNYNSYLEPNNTIDYNANKQKLIFDRFEGISNTHFEKYCITNYKENNISSIDSHSDKEEIYFLHNKTKNNCPLNQYEKKIFAINKIKKLEKKNTNINSTNEKTQEKKGNYKIVILINDSGNEKKNETNFIGKKRNIFRVKSDFFNIFNPGENNYSKLMIHDTLNDNKNFENRFVLKKCKNSSIKGKKSKKNNLKRKENSDNIRKKIKSRFHRNLKQSINEKLQLAGSKNIFEYLPQIFITNITKNKNRNNIHLTLEEILSKDFCIGKVAKKSTINKYRHNVSVLQYLEKNKEISKKSNFNIFKDMKYHEIYEEYLNSKEFENEISKLREKETEKYINKYINKAQNLIEFFKY